jgi:hypothetical protein
MLSEARSNLPEMGNGADIFHRFVDPLRIFPAGVAAHVAITALVGDGEHAGSVSRYRFRATSFKKQRHGRLIMATARIELEERLTERRHDFGVAAMHFGGVDFYCVARAFPGARQFNASAARLWANFRTGSLPVMLRIAQEELGPDEFGLESVLPDGRQRISELVFGDIVGNFAEQYARLYEANQRVLEMLQDAGLELPQELTAAAEYTFSRRFEEAVRRASGSEDPKAYLPAIRITEEAEHRGFAIDHSTTAPLFARVLADAVARTLEVPSDDRVEVTCALTALATKLGLATALERSQELYDRAIGGAPASDGLRRLGKELGFAVDAPPRTEIEATRQGA